MVPWGDTSAMQRHACCYRLEAELECWSIASSHGAARVSGTELSYARAQFGEELKR